MNKVDKAHNLLKRLSVGPNAPFGHSAEVVEEFMEWSHNHGTGLTFDEFSVGHVTGFQELDQKAAEEVLEWIRKEHSEILEEVAR